MILGLILALASALTTNVAFLFKHRGAVLAPPIRVRHPLRSAIGLFRSKWFLVGWIVAIAAWDSNCCCTTFSLVPDGELSVLWKSDEISLDGVSAWSLSALK